MATVGEVHNEMIDRIRELEAENARLRGAIERAALYAEQEMTEQYNDPASAIRNILRAALEATDGR